ncbi:MAG: extracellular solute-binding protein [Actinobacteria bacterium]|nr:extracellular solute-binding protein [Actinomycetota bacterium]MCA0434964.1 extracellular solute-binding protein [Actinomycetota bacterium]
MKRNMGVTLVAAAATLTLALTACSSAGSAPSAGGSSAASEPKTLTIWDYESDESAMGQAWAKAVEIFKAKHPDVTVKEEAQTFEQIQKNAKIVLTGDSVPDVMEYNKGNATAGQLAAQGLITPLTDAAKQYGWESKLAGSLATTAKYNDKGLMGSGEWYGVPNYGEFVGVYYNKDLFAKYDLQVPTTMDEFVKVMDTFKAKGVTPLATAGAEYPLGQLWYELVLANADRSFVNDYQLFANDVDFQGAQMTAGTTALKDWISKGYIDKNVAALKAEDMGVSFIKGKYPMMVSGSWWFGRLATEMKADWGMFTFPGNALHPGSSGNIWVIPTKAKSPELAKEFIDITLSPEVQNVLAEKGGLPVAGDTSVITDAKVKELTTNFDSILKQDGLAFYPDWPVPGYYDVIVAQLQALANGNKDVPATLEGLGKAYAQGKDDLLNG